MVKNDYIWENNNQEIPQVIGKDALCLSVEFGDHIPPNIYKKKPVFLKCKQQFIGHFLEITEKCPINSIIDLKHGQFAGSIHTIIADTVHSLLDTYTTYIVYKHVQKSYCRLSIGATGGCLVKK